VSSRSPPSRRLSSIHERKSSRVSVPALAIAGMSASPGRRNSGAGAPTMALVQHSTRRAGAAPTAYASAMKLGAFMMPSHPPERPLLDGIAWTSRSSAGSTRSASRLCAYSWPGNIRELQNVVERAVILARGPVLSLPDLELPGLASEAVRPGRDDPSDQRQQIEQALVASRGRVYGSDGAAETLGVPPSTLEPRIRRLGIDKHAFRSPRSRPGS
jgi:hypothetical protein